ncbi:bifunctional riboflavin kinase/FAD synthetase [Subtercola boreus]|uniref:Riboflavin biosynthesis protein n=1 Tax=Subtercola boreus TaxID=120213 RepID=A0A3E0WAK0_9MICO|nr:bifunctional riboflavin kinase/FAD synthetase [Subtercola boreus]RFA20234.1 riboflavin biosynthesis protein RibF [Subtercola boreus]RFA20386.1 riboflavin biosynthesis protein RibF [Subtercola boreus]RFA26638.1 riboflavin biosynthesis protein RibF [Subtercola boreus]
MKVFTSVDEIPADFGPSAITVGKFDGVHEGHRAVIRELLAVAARQNLVSTAVTFDRHPFAFLAPERAPVALVGNEQKLDLLAETGLDATLMLTFDQDVAFLSPAEFVERILVHGLKARVVLVGRDFRFGLRGEGDVQLLEEMGRVHGFEVRIIDDVMPTSDRRVSSTWIRELLSEGDVQTATALLGHAPAIQGEVVHGAKRGRELGFPTANLSPRSEGLIPADGVYAGWLTDNGTRYPAAISVGSNPTFDGVPPKQVEAFVLDETLDLYGHVVLIAFEGRIRGMVKYEGIEPLIAQMKDDVEQVRKRIL